MCQCTGKSARRSAFSQSCCGRFSPSKRQPASANARISASPTYLVTATSVIASARRPAAAAASAIRARTRARFSAILSMISGIRARGGADCGLGEVGNGKNGSLDQKSFSMDTMAFGALRSRMHDSCRAAKRASSSARAIGAISRSSTSDGSRRLSR